MYRLVIYGRAGQTEVKSIKFKKSEIASNQTINLMFLLHQHNIPIASSCYAEGICHKCVVTLSEKEILSCQVNLQDLFKEKNFVKIEVDYL